MITILKSTIGAPVAMECDVLEAPYIVEQIQWFFNKSPFPENTFRNQVIYIDSGRYLYINTISFNQKFGNFYCVVASPFSILRAPTIYRPSGDVPRGFLLQYLPSPPPTIFATIGETAEFLLPATYVSDVTGNIHAVFVSCPSLSLLLTSIVRRNFIFFNGLTSDITIVCNIIGTPADPVPLLELSFRLSSEFAPNVLQDYTYY